MGYAWINLLVIPAKMSNLILTHKHKAIFRIWYILRQDLLVSGRGLYSITGNSNSSSCVTLRANIKLICYWGISFIELIWESSIFWCEPKFHQADTKVVVVVEEGSITWSLIIDSSSSRPLSWFNMAKTQVFSFLFWRSIKWNDGNPSQSAP